MIDRDYYLKRLVDEADRRPVKILTGIRRCGKSFLFRQAIDYIKRCGIDDSCIVYLDFENFVLPETSNEQELQAYLESLGFIQNDDKKRFVFLDEIQKISGWEKMLSEFLSNQNIEFFIASSGTNLKNPALKEHLEGRYTEIKIHPLSYSEYRKISASLFEGRLENPDEFVKRPGSLLRKILERESPCDSLNKTPGLLERAMALRNEFDEIFKKYVLRGGFPGTLYCREFEEKNVLGDIYSSILYHDILSKHNIKNNELLEKIVKYIFEHIGDECSAQGISNYFKSKKYSKNISSIKRYLNHLEEAFVIKRIRRLNLETWSVQYAGSKYHAGNHALVYALSNNNSGLLRGVLESMLINELDRRGYEIYWGGFNQLRVEFAAKKENTLLLIQTVDQRDDIQTIQKKIEALDKIVLLNPTKVQLPFLLFFDKETEVEYENKRFTIPVGKESIAKYLSLPDFLLSETY
ncbi:MAG: AAA family ATPase [Spirochaetaceae bacterium]|jgi:predicted AAA+ superfamily ATPase|nr:AAA family ATPase [Spirochaetaceae bacterium]